MRREDNARVVCVDGSTGVGVSVVCIDRGG